MTCDALYSILEHGDRVTSMFKVDAMGMTPLTEALWWTMQVLIRKKEARKILIFLTDGWPENKAKPYDALQHSMRAGLSLMDTNLTDLLPKMSKVIKNMSQLAPTMFDLLGKSPSAGVVGLSPS